MHEMSIMGSALRTVFATAAEHNAQRVHRVGMRIGALSSVVPDALQFAFEAMTKDTIAEGAALDVEYLEVVCWCGDCSQAFSQEGIAALCPNCGGMNYTIRQGRELELKDVELS
jgi:hydrogenase nickel incorporation protein HypA/HybF